LYDQQEGAIPMRWKRMFIVVCLVIVALIATAYILLLTYDFNQLKPTIARLVQRASGRELRLDGDIKIRIGFGLWVSVEEVGFQNALWGSRPEMVQVRRVEAQIAILPLVKKTVKFKRLILVEPDILLETNESGASNFRFEIADRPKPTQPEEHPSAKDRPTLSFLVFNEVRVRRGLFTYRSGRSGKTYAVRMDRLRATGQIFRGPLQVDLDGALNGRPVQVAATLGPLTGLIRRDAAWPLEVTIKTNGTQVSLSGAVRDKETGGGLSLTVAAQGQSIVDIPDLAGIAGVPDLGPFRTTASLHFRAGKLRIEDLDFHSGTKEDVEIDAVGSIHDVLALQEIDLGFRTQGKDLTHLEKLIDRPLPIRGPFSVSGHVTDLATKVYRITDLSIGLGESHLLGWIGVDLTGRRPRLTAGFTSERFDVRPLLKRTDKGTLTPATPLESTTRVKKTPPDQTSPPNRLAVVLDMDLKLQAEEILMPWFTLKNLGIHGVLKDGGITVTAEGQSTPRTLREPGMRETPVVIPFRLAARLATSANRLSIEQTDLHAGTADLLDVRLKGAVRDLLALRGFDLSFTVRGKDFANLQKLFGKDLPITGPFAISGQLVDPAARTYRFADLTGTVLENRFGGWAELNTAGAVPQMTVVLGTQRLDLQPFVSGAAAGSSWLKALPHLGPAGLSVRVFDPLGTPKVEELDLRIGTERLAELRINGSIQDPLARRGVDLILGVKGKDLANLERALGKPLPFEGSFAISSRLLVPKAETYQFRDLQVTLGDNDLAGSVDLDLAGQRPRLLAELSSKQINLRPLLKRSEEKTAGIRGNDKSENQSARTSSDGTSRLENLTALDVHLRLQADTTMLPWMTFADLGIDMSLKEGALTASVRGQLIPGIGENNRSGQTPVVMPFELTAGGHTREGRLELDNVDLQAGTEKLALLRLKGTIQDLLALQGMDLGFTVQGDDLSNMEKLVERPLRIRGPFFVSGHVLDPALRMYKINDLKVVLGGSDFTGWVHVNLVAPRPRIMAALSSERFDLRPLLRRDGGDPPSTAGDTNPKKSRNRVFPDKPLSLDALRIVDTTVTMQIGQILLPWLAVRDLSVDVTLEDGHLLAEPLKCSVGGGSVEGRFDLRPADQAVAMTMDLEVAQLQLGPMLEELGVERYLEGTLGADIEFHGQGISIASLMAGLNGRLLVVMGDGRIKNRYIDLLGGNLTLQVYRLVHPLSQKEEYSETNCLVSHFDIKDGLAECKALVLDTKYTSVLGGGNLDLRTEKVNLAFKLSPKNGIGHGRVGGIGLSLGNLVKSFKLGGTLANPAISVNPKGAAITVGKALGGFFLLGPAGILIPFVDVSLGNKDPCLKAIEAAQKEVKKAMEGSTDPTKPKKKKGPLRPLKGLFDKDK
jgi:uncharacterized protein involved in outer membrane biogenesis